MDPRMAADGPDSVPEPQELHAVTQVGICGSIR
jgi:hypothetical protein